MRTIPLPNAEARRALAAHLFVSACGDMRQGFCASLASSLTCEPPIAPDEADVTEAEIQDYVTARDRMLQRLQESGRVWFDQMQKMLASELPAQMCGPEGEGWKRIIGALGVTRQDFCREAIIMALVMLQKIPSDEQVERCR